MVLITTKTNEVNKELVNQTRKKKQVRNLNMQHDNSAYEYSRALPLTRVVVLMPRLSRVH